MNAGIDILLNDSNVNAHKNFPGKQRKFFKMALQFLLFSFNCNSAFANQCCQRPNCR